MVKGSRLDSLDDDEKNLQLEKEIKLIYKRTRTKARQSHVWPLLSLQNIFLAAIIYNFAFGHLYNAVPNKPLFIFCFFQSLCKN